MSKLMNRVIRNIGERHYKAYLWMALYLITSYTLMSQPNWQVQNDIYVYSMTAIISIDEECNPVPSSHDMLAAFDQHGVCRGVADMIPISGNHIAFLTTYANDFNDTLYFRFYDADNDNVPIKEIISDSLFFDPTTTVGSIGAPLHLSDCIALNAFEFLFEDQTITVPETSFDPIILDEGHADTISCQDYSFLVQLPSGDEPHTACQINNMYSNQISGAAVIKYHNRSDFVNESDHILFRSSESKEIIGCGEAQIVDGSVVFGFTLYHENLPLSQGFVDFEYYSSQLDTILKRYSLIDLNSNKPMGSISKPIAIDVAPILITQSDSHLNVDLIDPLWSGTFCITIKAEDCSGSPCIDLLGNDCSQKIGNSDRTVCFTRDDFGSCIAVENRTGEETLSIARAEIINSDAIIQNDVSVQYLAGHEINLNPGFEVQLNGSLIAEIIACPEN